MSDTTNTVGEEASDCFWTPLILISGSSSDSIYAPSKLPHISPSASLCDTDFKADKHN